MSRPRIIRQLTIPLAVTLGVTILAFVAFIVPLRSPPDQTSPQTRQLPNPENTFSPQSTQPTSPPVTESKPPYEGPLGEFLVGINQGSDLPPCPRPWKLAKSDKIVASELYSPIFGDIEGIVTECADGMITVIEIYGQEIVSRTYFVGRPIAPYQAPLDRLMLLTVAGKPAIVELPRYPGELSLSIIERFPTDAKPGIALTIQRTTRSLDETMEFALRIMKGGGSR